MSHTFLSPEQLARLLAERISRHYQIRVSVHLNSHSPEQSYLKTYFDTPLKLSLSNLCRAYRDHPDDLEALLQLELQMIAGIEQNSVSVKDAEGIMPYLKSAGWLQDIQHQLHEQEHPAELKRLLISRPLLADLFVCYVYKNHTGIHYLTPQNCQNLGFDDTQLLHQKALENLRRYKEQVKCYELEGGAYSLVLDGIYDASLLLIISEILPESWLKETVIAVPARNELLLTRNQSHTNIAELTALVNEVRTKTAYPVSDNLYTCHKGQLRLFHIIADKHRE